MGLKVGHQVSYIVKNINLTTLYNVAFQLFQRKTTDGVLRVHIPTIYIDASWVVRSMTCSQHARPSYFIRLCCCLSRAGFHVVIICDGNERHYSKRSTIKRKAERYQNKITFMKKKCELQNLRHEIENEDSNLRLAELHIKELNLVSVTRCLYNKMEKEEVDVGTPFYNNLKVLIELHCLINIYKAEAESLKQITKMTVSDINSLTTEHLLMTSNLIVRMRKKKRNSDDNEISDDDADSLRHKKKKIRYCCACNKKSDTSPELKFTRIPIIGVKSIDVNSDNKQRKLHAKSVFKRATYLKRLNVKNKMESKGLEFCSLHVMNKEKVEIPFIDKSGSKTTFETIMLLPEDLTEEKRKTRSETVNIITTTIETHKQGRKKIVRSPKYVNRQKRNGVCDIYNCNHRESDEGTYLINIPRKPKKLNLKRKGLKNIERKKHACKVKFREYCCVSLGIHPNDKRSNLRFCNHHEIKRKKKTVVWYNHKGESKSVQCIMNLPTYNPIKPTSRKNKGTAWDRTKIRHVSVAVQKSNNDDTEMTQMLTMNQILEQNETNDSDEYDDDSLNHHTDLINDTVRDIIGIKKERKNLKLGLDCSGLKKGKLDHKILESNTTYQINTITDKEVTRCTGFISLASLVSFIVILNDGDINKMTETVTNLTWFEEYFLYFERIWGRTAKRWIECESKYNISEKSCKRIFDSKLNLHSICRKKWPRFATYEEDTHIKQQQWSDDYGDRRIIMWDNTDICIPKPSSAEAQRLTYSLYYGGNVGKGSIFIQPCGWMGTGELWMGAVSDSEYMERSGVLEFQKDYLQRYDSEYDDKNWHIILDKGYRINATTLRCGGQKVVQPSFARSDKKFTSSEMLRSSAIARNRAGNERAVRLVKQSGYLNSGLKQYANVRRLTDVWLCWGFQCNFMFASVIKTNN